MCVAPRCTLRHADPPDGDGAALAGVRGRPALTLDWLRSDNYPDDSPVARTDRLGLGSRSYRSDYVKFRHDRPDCSNRIYGHACRDRTGRLWLQYWCFYIYNDYHLAANFGLHEG